jgi:pimeloyl-ACP methyl ester carboxylesterase
VHAPTLLIGGQKSPALFKKILDALVESIPGARRVTIENADHFFTLTAQYEFERAVEVFWCENETN